MHDTSSEAWAVDQPWRSFAKPWRLAGFGLFQLWTYLSVLDPALFSSYAVGRSAMPLGVIQAIGITTGMAAMMLAGAFFQTRGKSKKIAPAALLAACGVAGVGSLLMGAAPEGSHGLVGAGAMLGGLGTSVLMFSWGRFWSALDPARMMAHLLASSIFACIAYVPLSLLPAPALTALLCLLPAASGAILLVCADEPSSTRDVPDAQLIYPSLWRVVAALASIAAAYSLIRSFYFQGSTATIGSDQAAVMGTFGVLAVVGGLWCVLGRQGQAVGRLYRTSITVMLLGFISAPALPDQLRGISLGAIMLGYSLFSELVWVMHPHFAVEINGRRFDLFGWNRVLLHLFGLAGTLAGYALLARSEVGDAASSVACMALTALVVLLAVNVMTERDFMQFINPLEVESPRPQNGGAAGRMSVEEACGRLVLRHGLSRREAEVFALLAQGRSLPYIEEQLMISDSTARTHARSIYRKLDVHSRQALLNVVQEEQR